MTTYLTAVVPRALEERFTAWLGPVDEQDHLVVDLPAAQARLHHVARAARWDLVAREPAGPAEQDGPRSGWPVRMSVTD